jgi:DNA (cytosine-5)-methyltransferase 1
MKSYREIKVGENKGAPRVWIEGMVPKSAGFLPGLRYIVEAQDTKGGGIALRLVDSGDRLVAKRERGGDEVPIIDLNSNAVLERFKGLERVRVIAGKGVIYVLPLASERRRQDRIDRLRQKLASGEPLSTASFSHGVGILSQAVADGMAEENVSTRLALANDIEGDFLEQSAKVSREWREDTIAAATPMQELAFDRWAMDQIGELDAIWSGIPCEGSSLSGRAKNGTPCAEAHEHVGHLVAAFLAVVARLNPAVVVVENVVPYSTTASAWIIRHQLRDLGYTVHETILDGEEFGVLERRKRWCMIAMTQGINFDIADIRRPTLTGPLKLGDVMEDVPLDDPSWGEMVYLKDKEARDLAAGKGFQRQVVGPESTHVGTIGKGYAKRRSTEPFVQHPTKPELLRLLTPREHAAVKGIDTRFIEGYSMTTAHVVMGQAVLPGPWKAVGAALARAILNWFAQPVQKPVVSAPAELFDFQAA